MAAASDAAPRLATSRGRALGTGLEVVVTRPEHLASAREAADAVIDGIDRTCSRFRADSELMLLQACAGEFVPVSPLLLTALQAALRGARLSDGAVDPTVGTAVRTIGYDDDFEAVLGDRGAIRLTVGSIPGWRCLRLDPVSSRALVPAGVELDLGSTAKALASDLAAAAALDAIGGGGVLVNLGGDIAVAGEPPPGGWVIQVSESSDTPVAPGHEAIAIAGGGLATSSTTVRRWRRGRVELHHIVDPRTGLPTTGPWRTVTCVAGCCLDANIAATAAIVRGAEAERWLHRLGLPSRLVGEHGAVVRTEGWPVAAATASASGGAQR